MRHPTDRIAHTTVFVTPVVEYWLEREIAIQMDSYAELSLTLLVKLHYELMLHQKD